MPKPYTPNDKWSRRAAEEGFRARSVYKLQEIDKKCHLFRTGMKVLDLGAAPGSWLQYVASKVGPKGTVIGVDLTEIEPIDQVQTYQADITDFDELNKIFVQENCTDFHVIISDLAPKTSGIKDVDQWRSLELSHAVIDVAKQYLKPGGSCVMKILRGADFDEFYADLKKEWQQVKLIQAKASRDRSREVYVIVL